MISVEKGSGKLRLYRKCRASQKLEAAGFFKTLVSVSEYMMPHPGRQQYLELRSLL
jgi:hypothetical protein